MAHSRLAQIARRLYLDPAEEENEGSPVGTRRILSPANVEQDISPLIFQTVNLSKTALTLADTRTPYEKQPGSPPTVKSSAPTHRHPQSEVPPSAGPPMKKAPPFPTGPGPPRDGRGHILSKSPEKGLGQQQDSPDLERPNGRREMRQTGAIDALEKLQPPPPVPGMQHTTRIEHHEGRPVGRREHRTTQELAITQGGENKGSGPSLGGTFRTSIPNGGDRPLSREASPEKENVKQEQEHQKAKQQEVQEEAKEAACQPPSPRAEAHAAPKPATAQPEGASAQMNESDQARQVGQEREKAQCAEVQEGTESPQPSRETAVQEEPPPAKLRATSCSSASEVQTPATPATPESPRAYVEAQLQRSVQEAQPKHQYAPTEHEHLKPEPVKTGASSRPGSAEEASDLPTVPDAQILPAAEGRLPEPGPAAPATSAEGADEPQSLPSMPEEPVPEPSKPTYPHQCFVDLLQKLQEEQRPEAVSTCHSPDMSGGVVQDRCRGSETSEGLDEAVLVCTDCRTLHEDMPVGHHAAAVGHLLCVQALHTKAPYSLLCFDAAKRSPLFHACANDRRDVCAFLIEHTPTLINVADSNGYLPLHAAAASGSEECTLLLLETGSCDVNAQNDVGMAPAHLGTTRGLLRVLVETKANIKAKDKLGRTPLHLACATNRVDCASYLSEVDVDDTLLTDDVGDTPLHAAAVRGHRQCVFLLCQFGASPTKQNLEGLTPIDLARRRGHQACLKILQEYHLHHSTNFDSVLFLATVQGHQLLKHTRTSPSVSNAINLTSFDGGWLKYEYRDGKEFWFNSETGQSSWTRPEEMESLEAEAQEDGQEDGPHVTQAPEGKSVVDGYRRGSRRESLIPFSLDNAKLMKLTEIGDWLKYSNNSTQSFYYNQANGDFHFETPADLPVIEDEEESVLSLNSVDTPRGNGEEAKVNESGYESHFLGELRNGWQIYQDASSTHLYYYNTLTNESTWEKPWSETLEDS